MPKYTLATKRYMRQNAKGQNDTLTKWIRDKTPRDKTVPWQNGT